MKDILYISIRIRRDLVDASRIFSIERIGGYNDATARNARVKLIFIFLLSLYIDYRHNRRRRGSIADSRNYGTCI